MAKLTVKDLLELKGKRQLICTTAHDYYTACACQYAGVDMIVTSGAFIRQYVAGDFITSGTMDDLLTALEGVRKGAPDAFIYVALPFGIANISNESAISAAMKVMDNGADGIYYSGITLERIKALTEQKVPVIGHAGMIPWHATWFGGCRAVGKTGKEAYQVYLDALSMQEAGCIGIELECVPHKVAKEISKRLDIITISMGSGFDCDGQYMFSHDILGQHNKHYPRHSVRYEYQYDNACLAMKQFVDDVKSGKISEKQKTIEISQDEMGVFLELLKNR